MRSSICLLVVPTTMLLSLLSLLSLRLLPLGAQGFVTTSVIVGGPFLRQHRNILVGDNGFGFCSMSSTTTEASETAETAMSSSSSSSSSNNDGKLPWPLDTDRYGAFQQDRDWGFAYSSAPPEAVSSYWVIDDDDNNNNNNIEGQVPADLVGTYYKTGPGKFEREGRRYEHVLDGDGFVAAFQFLAPANNDSDDGCAAGGGGGRVRYTGRFVETEYFVKEQTHDKIQYRNVFGTQRKGGVLTNAFDLTLKNVANTNILPWGGRLFALYEAGRPYELDPETLETLCPLQDGPFDGLGAVDCKLRGITIDEGGPVDRFLKTARSFTAHPHILDDNTLVAFQSVTRVKEKEAVLEFIEYDKDWKKKKSVSFAFPNGPPPHDFAVSENYYAFFENPFGPMDNLSYMLGLKSPAQTMQLLLRQPTALNLVPRSPSSPDQANKPLRFHVPPYFNIHTVAKAEERDGKLYLYSNGWDLQDERFFPQNQSSVPFLGSWGGQYPDFLKDIVPPSLLYRTVLDLQTEQVISHDQVKKGDVIEFPTQDDREPHKVYCSIASTNNTSIPGTGFVQYDLQTSTAKYWWAEHRVFTGEMMPVPKQNGEPGSWLLALIYDAANRRTSLVILDSERFEDGPICRLHLKHHLSYGLHSSFAPAKK